nr:sugar ABC transporter permease [Ruthenibacterium lactatiformans]
MADITEKNKHSQQRDEWWFAYRMVTPTVAVLLCMSVFSIVFTLYYGFTNYYYISKDPADFVGLKNYISLFKDPYFRSAMWNTVTFTLWCTLLETGLGVLVAVFVNSLRRGRNIVRTLVLMPYLLPPVTAALIWQVMLSSNYGIINKLFNMVGLPTFNWFFDTKTAMPVIIAIDVWQCMPFCFLLSYAALQSIPNDQYEAAKIDGAGKLQEFLYITLPGLKNTIVLCLLLRTIDSFRMFDKINILTGGGPANTTATITQYIYTYGVKSLKFGFASAGAIVMALLVLILSSFYIKRAMKA